MAIDAHDLALVDLSAHPLHGPPHMDHLADHIALHADVIELEDDRVKLPAIRATARASVLDQLPGLTPSTASGRLGLVPMQLTTLYEIASEAPLAPPLATLWMSRKVRQWHRESTAATSPEFLDALDLGYRDDGYRSR